MMIFFFHHDGKMLDISYYSQKRPTYDDDSFRYITNGAEEIMQESLLSCFWELAGTGRTRTKNHFLYTGQMLHSTY